MTRIATIGHPLDVTQNGYIHGGEGPNRGQPAPDVRVTATAQTGGGGGGGATSLLNSLKDFKSTVEKYVLWKQPLPPEMELPTVPLEMEEDTNGMRMLQALRDLGQAIPAVIDWRG